MRGGGQAGDAWRCPPRPFPSCQVLVPTRVGQVYVYDSPKGEQDEYDFPRHLLSAGSQEIYDVPPVRGGVPSQFSQEVRLGRRCGKGLWLPSPSTGDALAQPDFSNLGKLHPKLGTLWALGLLLAPPPFLAAPWENVGVHTIPDTPSCVPPFRSMTPPPWQ